MPRPVYLDACRSLLEREWNAEKCNGYEADDGIGMAHSEHTIIVSNDKDFRQLEGEIFNPIKNGGQFEMVDSQEAAHTFYSQLLEGDTSDNVRGIDGLGKVLSRRYLEGCTPEEMHSKVFCRYGNPERFFLNYRLLRILRTEEEWREVENQLSESKGPQVTTDCQGLDSESLSTVDTP
jgi:5'-3' exonuclease